MSRLAAVIRQAEQMDMEGKEWGNVAERYGTAQYVFTGGSIEVVCGEVERGK